MKQMLIVMVAALALPAAAHGKEITGLAVCGANACEDVGVAGWAHQGPVDPRSDGQAAPRPAGYYELRLEVDGRQDGSPVFYEPQSQLAAYLADVTGRMVWTRLRPEVATAVKQAGARVDPFPPPRVTKVRIGERVLRDGAATYLRLFEVDGAFALPGDGPGWRIRLSATRETPWTEGSLLYYPEDRILTRGDRRFVVLSPALAADVEALRPLGGGGGGPAAIPWIALGVLLAGLAALLAIRLRRSVTRAPQPRPTPAR